jgi:hypothetical protein
MNKETGKEKLFASSLDRVLAGKEIPADTITDADMLSALEFSQKMAELQPAISPRFQKELKNRLLEKLEKQEASAEKPVRNWGIFRQPAWRAAAAVFLVVVVISVVWSSGLLKLIIPQSVPTATSTTTTISTTTTKTSTTTMTSTTTTTTIMPVAGNILGFDVATTKRVYSTGEPVVINLTYKNVSPQVLDLEKIPPILSVMSSETGQPVYTFAAGKEIDSLAPGNIVKFTYKWNQVDFEGQSVTGSYYLELEDLQYQGQTLKFQLPNPVRFEILP